MVMVVPPARTPGRDLQQYEPRRSKRMRGLARLGLTAVFVLALLFSVMVAVNAVAKSVPAIPAAATALRQAVTTTAGVPRQPVTTTTAGAPGRATATTTTLAAGRVTTTVTDAAAGPEKERPGGGVQPPSFRSFITTIDAGLEKELRDTNMWSEQVPVKLEDLRVLHVSYWGFDSKVHSGRLIVNHAWAVQLGKVFHKLFDARFPIRRMDPVDYLGMKGEGLVASDNTMSFNGRKMRGGSAWSMHAYGLAVDIDPAENPYVRGDMVIPGLAARHADRSKREPGMLHSGDVVVEAFTSIGWKWGGDWKSFKDYMHFSSNGR